MSRQEGITFRGSNYEPDWATGKKFSYSYTMKVPDGLAVADIDAIVAVLGGVIVDDTSRGIPCDRDEGFPWSPRKLKFWLATGKTISVPIPVRGTIVTEAASIAGVLSALAPVVCVSLEGETWRNIIDEVAPGKTVTPLAVALTTTGEKEPSFVGSMKYNTDSGIAGIIQNFKMASNRADNLPYEIYADAIVGCLESAGTQVDTSSARCPGFKKRRFDPRRFTITMIQDRQVIKGKNKASTATQELAKSKLQVPVTANTVADISTCAAALGAVSATACLAYRGEWDPGFSKRNALVLPP